MLTVVMYHYVRPLPRTRYPEIRGLQTEKFEGQLDYILKHYTVCSLRQVIAAARGEEPLPHNACVLTFDDGLIDHYLTVFPRLEERGIVGGFFPSGRAVQEHRVLDVHKIHFILASTREYGKLAQTVLALISGFREQCPIATDEALYAQYATQSRYDPPDVMFVKGILQRGLPEEVRSEIVHRLFADWVTEDEEAFAHELYMDISQLRCLARHGMEIGGHGYQHGWLGSMSGAEQQEEISATVQFLTAVHGHAPVDWVMCYPYGSYNRVTLELLQQSGCALGLTCAVELVEELSRPLEIARLDTTDLPCSGTADRCQWTEQVARMSAGARGAARFKD